jgi:hypothetical protein
VEITTFVFNIRGVEWKGIIATTGRFVTNKPNTKCYHEGSQSFRTRHRRSVACCAKLLKICWL